ncbi:MAG: type II secretion system F family protein, partial [bacterium]|nr:type II secretion system F family protein [bacterium]
MARVFRYKGRSADGRAVEGSLEGVSADGVASELLAQGVTPLGISEASGDSDLLVRLERWWAQRQIGLSDLVMFSRQMCSLSRAGIPIIRTLESIASSSRNVEMKRVLGEIAGRLQAG